MKLQITFLCLILFTSCDIYMIKSRFSEDYKFNNTDKAIVNIHSPIELFHIILTLTKVAQNDKYMLRKNTIYYEEVIEHFEVYKNKRAVKLIDEKLTRSPDLYHEFIKFLYNYHFNGENLVLKDDIKVFSSLKKYIPMMEDFAKNSNYFGFFDNHSNYYQELISYQKEMVNKKKIWQWLEKEFSNSYQCYKTIFSPLTGGNHSTIRFTEKDYKETIFFVSAPFLNYQNEYYSARLNGVVFTEIDHNYVNPISKAYNSSIKKVLSNREKWVRDNKVTKNYPSSYTVFNEYLTHALFCVYLTEEFELKISEVVIQKRIKLMEDIRGFRNFGKFTKDLLKLRKDNRHKTIETLYPQIIQLFGENK